MILVPCVTELHLLYEAKYKMRQCGLKKETFFLFSFSPCYEDVTDGRVELS